MLPADVPGAAIAAQPGQHDLDLLLRRAAPILPLLAQPIFSSGRATDAEPDAGHPLRRYGASRTVRPANPASYQHTNREQGTTSSGSSLGLVASDTPSLQGGPDGTTSSGITASAHATMSESFQHAVGDAAGTVRCLNWSFDPRSVSLSIARHKMSDAPVRASEGCDGRRRGARLGESRSSASARKDAMGDLAHLSRS